MTIDTMINELTNYASGASSSMSNEMRKNASDWLGIDVSSRENAGSLAQDIGKIKAGLESLNIDKIILDTKFLNFARNLARDLPSAARRNAYNWEFFVQEYYFQ